METKYNQTLPHMRIPRIKYEKKASAFYVELRRRVNQYFAETACTRYANRTMHIRSALLIVFWFGLYALVLSNWFRSWDLFAIQCLYHLTSFVVWVGIAHDAHHHAYTPNKRLNKLLLFVGDLVGVSSYVMDYNHVKAHHSGVNLPVHDVSIDDYGLFRFHPQKPYRKHFRYQHFYIVPIYLVPTLFKLFIFDFFSLLRKNIGSVPVKKHDVKQLVFLVLVKAAVIFATLVLPCLVLDAPNSLIIAGFICGHLLAGLALSLVFQITHLCDYSRFSAADPATGKLNNSFAIHVIENTSSFSVNSAFMSWFSGGLNHHTIHHIFPEICQIHFPALTKILQQTAAEYGIPFKVYPTFWAAIQSHFRLLKRLGKNEHYQPVPFTEYPIVM